MKILSSYKDYYDYLTGMYGEDPKIILDRRKFDNLQFFVSSPQKITLYICGWVFEGYWLNGKFYWGNDLELIKPFVKNGWDFKFGRETIHYIQIGNERIHRKCFKDIENYNIKENCPILFNKNCRFPILKNLNISSILPPQEIYLKLVEWLSPKEDVVDTRTNKEKILTNGFDLQTSFRNPIK